jgi:hypothetical protein
MGGVLVALASTAACNQAPDAAKATELQRIRSGAFDVVLLSRRESLHQGKDTFIIEFRSTREGALVDVGNVRATASMPMPGMPMFASIDVRRSDVAGRYSAASAFSMAGTWRMSIDWDGAAGKGSVTFSGSVQ